VISVELNTALKTHLTSSLAYGAEINVFPLSAYDQTTAPFILYFEDQTTLSDEQWFVKTSNVMYYVYDNNISRMKDIAHVIDRFFNVGDEISGIRSKFSSPGADYGSYRYRLVSSRKIAGSGFPPIEREGFAAQMLNFRVVYLDQDA
jgi:hypothetical protein